MLPETKQGAAKKAFASASAEIARQKAEWDGAKDTIKKYYDEYQKGGKFSKKKQQELAQENGLIQDNVALLTSGRKTWGELNAEKDEQFKEPERPKSWGKQVKSFASSALSTLGNMTVNAIGGMVVQELLSLGIKGIDYLAHKDEYTIASGKEARENIAETTRQYEVQRTTLKSLGTEYAKLAKGVRISGDTISNLSLSDEDFSHFLDISNQMAAVAPTLVKQYDDNGNAILSLGTAQGDINKSLNEYINLQRDLSHITIKDNLAAGYKGALKEVDQITNEGKALQLRKAENDKLIESTNNLKEALSTDDLGGKTLQINSKDSANIEKILRESGFSNGNNGGFVLGQIDIKSGTQDLIFDKDVEIDKATREKIIDATTQATEDAKKESSLLASQIKQQELLAKSKAKELAPSIGAYIDSSNMFDGLASGDADKVKSNLKTMVNNLDFAALKKDFEAAGGIDKWIDSQLIAPMMSGSKQISESWKNLFDLEDEFNAEGSQMKLGDYSKRRDALLKEIAQGQGISWQELAKSLGYKAETESGDFIWTRKNEIDRAANGKASPIGKDNLSKYLNGLNKEKYEVAIDLILNGDKVFTSTDQIDEAVNARIKEVEEIARLNELSYESMASKVLSAQSALSSYSTSLSESASKSGLGADTIAAINSQFSELEGYDLNSLFFNTAEGVKLNADVLRDLNEAQNSVTAGKFQESIALQNDELARQEKILNKLEQPLREHPDDDMAKTAYDDAKTDYDALLNKLNQTKQAQAQFYALKKQQEELFSDYNSWLIANESPNAGSKYENMASGLKAIKQIRDKGLVGTDEFKAFAKLISPYGTTDSRNFDENYAKAQRYLTEDESGPVNFLKDLDAKGLAAYNEQTQQWAINVRDVADAAKQLGVSEEFMTNMFGRLEDYGFHNNVISDEQDGIFKLTEAYEKLAKAQSELSELEADPNASASALEAKQKEVAGYEQDTQELSDSIEYYAQHKAERLESEREIAKKQIEGLVNKRNELLKDDPNGENSKFITDAFDEEIRHLESKYDFTPTQLLSPEEIQRQKQAYVDALQKATVENPVKPDFGGDVGASEQFDNVTQSVQKAWADGEETLKNGVKELSQFSSNELKGITLGNGEYDYDTPELRAAEDTLENMASALGLSSEQANILVSVLEAMGLIKPEIDDSSIEEAKETADDTRESYEHLDGSTMSIVANVENADGVNQFAEECASIPQGMSTTITADISGEETVSALEEGLNNLPDNTPVTIDCQVTNAEEADNLQAKVNALNENGKQITLNTTIKPTIDSEETEVPVKPSPDPLKVNVEPVEVPVKSTPDPVTVNVQSNQPNTPENPQGTVDFGLGESPKEVPDAKGTANFDLGKSPESVPDASGTVNFRLGYYPTSLPPITQTVFQQIVTAHGPRAAGTMLSPAHASGTAYNVLNMTPAFANGDVSLSKDERALVNELGTESIVRDGIWSLLPGGAHFENLKKGDIIFSAQQTKDLLSHGKTDGHARAYANGTGSLYGQFDIPNKTQNNNSSSSSVASNVEKTVKKSAEKVSDSSSKLSGSLDDVIKKLDNMKDWIERKIDIVDRKIDKYQTAAEKAGGGHKTENNLERAINALSEKLDVLKEAKGKYRSQADSVASSLGLSKDLKNKVENGKIDIESLSEEDKKRVDSYEKWYQKIIDIEEQILDTQYKLIENKQSEVQNVIDTYDVVIGKREAAQKKFELKQELRVQRGQSQKPGSIYDKYMHKELYYAEEQARLGEQEVKTYKKKMKEYLNTPKDKGGAGKNTKDRAYQEMKKTLVELTNSTLEAKIAVEEIKDAIQENTEMILQWGIDRWQRAGQKLDTVRDYKDIADDYTVTEKDYNERMQGYSKEVEATYKLLNEKKAYYQERLSQGATVSNEEMQKALQEITDLENQIVQLGISMEELKNQIMALRWKPFEDAQEKLSRVTTEYETLMQLLGDDESFFNDDGSYTTNGLTNILLLQESIDATKQKIANYRQALDDLEVQYKNGCWSEQEYIDKTKELTDGIRDAATAVSGYEQQMLNMYESQIKMENDLLQKNINKRLEALGAKEKYYDYDKTLKKKSKDINTLKAQIAALEGTSNAAAKARLETLKAELVDAEEDMNDTVHKHELEMKKTGFEDLSTDAENALKNTLDALKKNTDFQKAVIGDMLEQVKANYDSAYEHVNEVVKQHGIVVSDTFNQMIQKVADFKTQWVGSMPGDFTMDNSGVNMGSNTAQGIIKDTVNGNDSLSEAGKQNFEKELKKQAQAWYDALPGSSHYEDKSYEKASPVMRLFMSNNKGVNGKRLQQLADIIGFNFEGYDPDHPIKWPERLQTEFIREAKKYIRFAEGGLIDYGRYIPVSELNQAIRDKGEWGLIAARRKELVLNEKLSEALQTDLPRAIDKIDYLSQMFDKHTSFGNARVYEDNTVNEVNVYVQSISNDIDIRKLATQIDEMISKSHVRDMRKLL